MLLTKNSTNTVFLTSDVRKTASEYYYLLFTSEYDRREYPVFPTLLLENDRFIKLQIVENIAALPLTGSVNLVNAGTYKYSLYTANSLSLTASFTFLQQGFMNLLEGECTETVEYTYVSDNEDAEASVFLSSTCSFTENLEFILTLDSRAGATQHYMLDLRSEYTNINTSVFPTLLTTNDRYVSLGFTNSNSLTASALDGIVSLSPAGTYKMSTYIADSLSLTASRTFLDERYIVITTCNEDTIYTYLSDNENATAIVYNSGDCVTCKVWDTWTLKWDEDPVIWDQCN